MTEDKDRVRPLSVVGQVPQQASNELLVLAGRRFEFMSQCTHAGRRHWERCLRKGGLATLSPSAEEDRAEFTERVRARLLDSGVGYRLAAMRLVGLGEPWTPEKAGLVPGYDDETVPELLSRLTAPEDVATVEVILERIVEAIVAEAVAP